MKNNKVSNVLPEKFPIIVSYQEGDYIYGEKCKIKSLLTVLKDSRRRHWMGWVEEGSNLYRDDNLVLVHPGRKVSFVSPFNEGVVYFKGVEYPYGGGDVDWSRGSVGKKPALSREEIVTKIIEIIFDEFKKIEKLTLSEAWLKNFTPIMVIYNSDGVLLERTYAGYSYTDYTHHQGHIWQDIYRSGGPSPSSIAKTISDSALDKLLNTILRNFDCPDYVMESMPKLQIEELGLKKKFCPMEIQEIRDMWTELKKQKA